MPEILLGGAVLFLLLWAVNAFSKADPKQAARVLRAIGGGVALLLAGFLMLRGEIGVAIPVGALTLTVKPSLTSTKASRMDSSETPSMR